MLVLVSEQPKCKYCGLLMDSWTFGQAEHAHNNCRAEHIVDRLMRGIEAELAAGLQGDRENG